VKDIYEAYKSGTAWEITLELLKNYEHGTLPPMLEQIENVFIIENDEIERIGYDLLFKGDNDTITDLLTFSDNMLQCHAYKMEKILLDLSQFLGPNPVYPSIPEFADIIEAIESMWSTDYITTLKNMKTAVSKLNDFSSSSGSGSNRNSESSDSSSDLDSLFAKVKNEILEIMDTRALYKISEAECIVDPENLDLKSAKKIYEEGVAEVENKHFTQAADKYLQAFEIANCLVLGKSYDWEEENPIWTTTSYLVLSGVIILVVIFCAMARFRKKRKSE
jgi:hypothetical protein